MKKSILISALIALAFSVNAQQYAMRQMPAERPIQKAVAEDGSMQYGYCSDEIVQYIGIGQAATLQALIEIPAEDAAKFEGCQVTKVNLGIGYYSGSVKVIIMSTLGSEPTYTQECQVKDESWNEIALETPYTIGKEAFYIGYEVTCTQDEYPIGTDGAVPASEYGDYVGILSGTSFQYMKLGEQGFGNNNIKLVLTGNNLPKYDLSLESISMPEYLKTGEEFSIKGSVKNKASKTISSFDIIYQIDDLAPITVTANNALANSASYDFAIDGVKFEQDGTHSISVTIANLDGNADENDGDNSHSAKLVSLTNFVPRKVLVENFSTASCGNCPRVHRWMKSATAERNDVAWVVHHSGYYTDDFTIEESEHYLWLFGGSTYAPALMMDRTCLGEQGATRDGENMALTPTFLPTSQSQIEELINYCIEQQAVVSVAIEDVYNEETRELAVKVSGKAEGGFARTPYIHIFLTEDGLIGPQSGSSSNYQHNHALRKVMTSTWGDELEMNGNDYEVTYTCTLDDKWLPENMSVIAFIAHNDDYDTNRNQVLNTEWKVLEYGAGVNDVAADKLNVWTTDKAICIDGSYNNAAVYAIDGRVVTEANGASIINVENNGVYIVVIDGTSYKVVVK